MTIKLILDGFSFKDVAEELVKRFNAVGVTKRIGNGMDSEYIGIIEWYNIYSKENIEIETIYVNVKGNVTLKTNIAVFYFFNI
jgi:hypothetical protein